MTADKPMIVEDVIVTDSLGNTYTLDHTQETPYGAVAVYQVSDGNTVSITFTLKKEQDGLR